MNDKELIQMIAEKVMGWTLTSAPPGTMWKESKNGPGLFYGEDRGAGGNAWNPINNANHWMMVVEKLRYIGLYLSISSRIGCYETWYKNYHFYDLVAGRAVCLAALQAMEEK